jgi:type IV secretion system protein VirB6
MRKIAADYQQTQGTLPDIGYAVFSGFLVVMVIIATLLCAAIGFVISAFGLFALALLSVVGPLFVAGLLFESTRGYFFAWLGACINYLMLIVFALVLTLFLTQTGDAVIAAIKALAFYALGFFFFLQIPMLAASLGGGGPALANQFASAIAAAGGFVAGRGATATQATSRAIERGFARGIARMRASGSVSRGTQ